MIALEKIHSYYGTSHILQGIDLQVKAGEVVSLLGRNGAGKTTTLKTIMGLLNRRPREPSPIKGNVISGLKPFKIARKGIAYVPEDRAVFIHLSVVENLEIARVGMASRLQGKWTVERIFQKFPRLAERTKPSRFGPCPAESSKC